MQNQMICWKPRITCLRYQNSGEEEDMEQQTYAEASVRKKETAGTQVLKGILIAVIVLLSLLMLMTRNIFLTPFIAAAIVFAVYYFPRFHQIYEVIYCDGQFDFDRIAGNSRKTLLQMDMEDIEVIAPLGHEALANFNASGIKKDYSSGEEEKTYVILGGAGEKKYQVYFNPTDKMLDCIYFKAPSKLKRK